MGQELNEDDEALRLLRGYKDLDDEEYEDDDLAYDDDFYGDTD
jgi:hypothetical protein